MTGFRPTWAEIDLGAIRDNVAALRSLLAPRTRHLAVVKANAYGHGDVPVARACLEAGADWLGVALVEEGVRLREAGIEAPILVLVEPEPGAAAEVVRRGLTPSVSSHRSARAIGDAAGAAGAVYPVHVTVDTGMHREGATPAEALEIVARVLKHPGLRLEGVWSHLAVADEPSHPATDEQVERFADLCDELARRGIEVPLRHLANSAGAMANPEAHFDLVRTGIAVYGLYPQDWLRDRCRLRPAMRLAGRVGAVRRVTAGRGVSYGLRYAPTADANVATVPIGYADGFSRLLSNRGSVLVRGKRRAVAGTVTMDQIMVDCGDDPVEVGDEVVIIGRQGAEEITAGEVASWIGTIHYEVVSAIGARVPRVYQS